jgi:hypothetical protein
MEDDDDYDEDLPQASPGQTSLDPEGNILHVMSRDQKKETSPEKPSKRPSRKAAPPRPLAKRDLLHQLSMEDDDDDDDIVYSEKPSKPIPVPARPKPKGDILHSLSMEDDDDFDDLPATPQTPGPIQNVREGDVDMDSNPFEHFVTSPDVKQDHDDEDGWFDGFTAGIETIKIPKEEIHSFSPSSLQRPRSPSEGLRVFRTRDSISRSPAGKGYAFSAPVKQFAILPAHTISKKSARPAIDLKKGPQLPRGRKGGNVKLGPLGSAKAGNRERPRSKSWREPSPDVWTIPEIEEEKTQGLIVDEEAIAEDEEVSPPADLKKKVRWASV